MNMQEKMKIIEESVAYARVGAYNCLNCIGPAGWNYAAGTLSCRGPYSYEIQGVINALKRVGISPDKVRTAIGGSFFSCCDVDRYLGIVRNLLK